MMVTFISQCEKKALDKTRRVLDSFANRIGDKTWQTVITEDGLLAVKKKLLRRTASKNTAVACHWIRSRSRSEIIWVVGNRNKFNYNGIVPVNTTSWKLIMDDITENHGSILANTKEQSLVQHLFAVGYIAHQLIQKLTGNKKIALSCFVAGCLHDIGKLDPLFQDWIKKLVKKKTDNDILPDDGVHIEKTKKFFEKHPRHNEISLILNEILHDKNDKLLNARQREAVKHAIYWHHAKSFRKIKYRNQADIYKVFNRSLEKEKFESFTKQAIKLLVSVNAQSDNYLGDGSLQLPKFCFKPDEDRLDFYILFS